MSILLVLVTLATVLGYGNCGNHTVTDEAWFEVEIKDYYDLGDHFTGRFVIALFGETVPMTVMNFAALTKGHKLGREFLTYKHTAVHRVVRDFVVQMGDVQNKDGTGGKSIFGSEFVDENFIISHKAAGYVSMANHGPDSNSSQFFILLTKSRWLDKSHVSFGKVVRGMDVVRIMGEVDTRKGTADPTKEMKIVDCGLVGLAKKYELTKEQSESNDDIDE